MKPFSLIVADIEANGLYDTVTEFHCGTIVDCYTGESQDFRSLEEFVDALDRATLIVGHNIIDFDLPAVSKLSAEFKWSLESAFDTLVLSRLLYPDLPGGHSLDEWGKRLGEHKTDYRQVCIDKGYIDARAPKGEEFRVWRPEMSLYCNQDCKVNLRLLMRLIKYTGWSLDELVTICQRRIVWTK